MRPGLSCCLFISLTMAAQAQVQFRKVVLDPQVAERACYAVDVADVDGDGKLDIIAVNERQVLWYRNPDWQKKVIISSQTELDNVCIAPLDIDGDGKIDFALGAGWTKVGTIQWLKRGVTLDEPWTVHHIGTEIWTHRMRWANVLGKDRPQLVVSPLNAVDRPGVRLLAFEIPQNPLLDRWPATVLDESLNRLHNHWHVDHNGDGVAATLTASQEGLNLISRNEDGSFRRRLVGSGMLAEKPEDRGAGEVKLGKFRSGRPYMATIEPMHGTTVAVYTAPPELPEGTLADRQVLEESLRQGHAVWTADVDGDGDDELIIGFREPGEGDPKGPGIFLFDPQDEGKTWKRSVIDDGGVAVEDLLCADLNGDGRPEIIAGGRATKNLVVYWNQGEPAAGLQAGPDGWIPLFDGKSLKNWESTPFGGEAEVLAENGELTLKQGEPLTGITWKGPELPKVNYEITLEAQRVDGGDFFCALTVPVKETACSLVLGGWGGTVIGISSINGSDASENETTDYYSFKKGEWYKVRMRVTDTHIQAWLNDDQIANVDYTDKQIGVRIEVEISRPLGISSYRTEGKIRNFKMRRIEPEPAADN
jgi:hypothetical protein